MYCFDSIHMNYLGEMHNKCMGLYRNLWNLAYLLGAKCFLGERFTTWNMTNQISQYVHKRFFYRIFRSQFRLTQKLEKSSLESLLLPQLLGGENDSKQSDEFQAISETEISNLGNIAWFHFSKLYLLKYRIQLPPFSLIRDFSNRNTRWNFSKISVNHTRHTIYGGVNTSTRNGKMANSTDSFEFTNQYKTCNMYLSSCKAHFLQ